MTSRCRAPSVDASGFTLIEMIAVLAIMGFALLLVVGYKAPWSRGFEIDTAASELAAQLRLVRSQAIAENRGTALTLDLTGRRYRAGKAPWRPLPARVSIRLLTVATERRNSRFGGIRFYPDGSSTGGRIVLADEARRITIGVEWLTGRIQVANAR